MARETGEGDVRTTIVAVLCTRTYRVVRLTNANDAARERKNANQREREREHVSPHVFTCNAIFTTGIRNVMRERGEKEGGGTEFAIGALYVRGLPPLLPLANTMSGFVENFCGLLTPVFRVRPPHRLPLLLPASSCVSFPDTAPIVPHTPPPPRFPRSTPSKSASLNRSTRFRDARAIRARSKRDLDSRHP